MIEVLWVLVSTVVTGLFILLGTWFQSRKDTVRIKDIDDKTDKIEPTFLNTEKIIDKVDCKFNDNLKVLI